MLSYLVNHLRALLCLSQTTGGSECISSEEESSHHQSSRFIHLQSCLPEGLTLISYPHLL